MSKLLVLQRGALLPQSAEAESRGVPLPDLSQAALEAVSRLSHGGFLITVVSHQPGVARGQVEMSAINAAHRRFARQLEEGGGRLDAIAVCPHAPDEGCVCRMPRPGMLLDLMERFEIAPSATVMIASDEAGAAAGLAAGCETRLLLGAESESTLPDGIAPSARLSGWAEAASALLAGPAPADEAEPPRAGRQPGQRASGRTSGSGKADGRARGG